MAFKSMFSFCYFYVSFIRNIFTFFASLYKELLETDFSPFPIVFDNLFEVFGCSVITDFVSTIFGFSKVFG